MTSENNTSIEHQNIPSAHQGLHGFLYSSEDEHTSNSTPTTTLEQDGSEVVAVKEWQPLTSKVKIAGVYAVLDQDQQTQYIGYSRDIRKSLEGHLAQQGEETCAFIRIQTFKFPKRDAMEALKDEWIAALDYTPQGNEEGQEGWAKTVGEATRASMSAADKEAYEEKKLKLRKAMADSTLIDELEQNDNDTVAERHRKLEAAVKNDDWSSVVDS